MEDQYVKLSGLDRIMHYSVSLYFAAPIVIFLVYYVLGQMGVLSPLDIWLVIIPGIFLLPIATVFYFIQRDKLKFELIETSMDVRSFKTSILEMAKEHKWTVTSIGDELIVLRTNPGFVNQSWGQQLTIKRTLKGILVNSISDPSKGAWLTTFGGNRRNVSGIRDSVGRWVKDRHGVNPVT